MHSKLILLFSNALLFRLTHKLISVDFSDTQIQVAIISGTFTLLSALIAATAAGLLGKYIANRQALQDDLQIAIGDIDFLLQVERLHCDFNKKTFDESRKILVRRELRNSGISFSGKFTPGRVRSQERTYPTSTK